MVTKAVSLTTMATEFSFDVVSDFDQQEMVNAVDQARREIGTRYDFKGVTAEIELDKSAITLTSSSEMHLKAILDVLQSKVHKRGLDLRVLDPKEPEPAAKGTLRQKIELRRGIPEELAKELQKRIKTGFPKAQARIQGDQLRVSARDKDLLQSIIQELKGAELPAPLQFTNYR